jgi:hypothetical protein
MFGRAKRKDAGRFGINPSFGKFYDAMLAMRYRSTNSIEWTSGGWYVRVTVDIEISGT